MKLRALLLGGLAAVLPLRAFAQPTEQVVVIGTRTNHVNYFNGAIAEARFTDHALTPAEFLKAPRQ